jgi:HSF-type DNA-binding
VKRTKKATNDDSDECQQGNVATVAKKKESSSDAAPSKGTYPKPKNFAERMMNVLENNVDPDVVKWHGDDDRIAINTKTLRSSDILDDRFQGIRYAAFIRNLSRW